MLMAVPAGLANLVALEFGRPSFPFIATRPISSSALVRSKFQMALVSALAAYVPVLLVLPLFFVWTPFLDSALQAARSVGAPKAVLILLLAAVLPVVLTWKGLVENLWMGLTGRAWLTHCYAMVGAGRGDTADSGSGAEVYVVIGQCDGHPVAVHQTVSTVIRKPQEWVG